MNEWLSYWTVKCLGVLARALPYTWALAGGRCIGRLVYVLHRKHRRQTYVNLRIAFGDQKSIQDIRQINLKTFEEMGQNLIDALRLPLITPETFHRMVEVEGKEHIEAAVAGGKGVILLAMHFGSWELASMSCAMWKLPYKILVRPKKKMSRLHALLNTYRQLGGAQVLERGAQTKNLIQSLNNNEIISMVVDQGGKDGMTVPFFRRPASMSVGAIRIGLKKGVPVLFSVIVRLKGGKHKIIVYPPLDNQPAPHPEDAIRRNLMQVMSWMEEYVARYPEQYVWFYKIWKYSTESNLLILSDGKAGHDRQSEALARATQTALSERQIASHVQTLSIHFKSRAHEVVFSLWYAAFGWLWYVNRLRALAFFLKKESYDEIIGTQTDFVISTGASLSALNRFIAHDQQAKSMVILRPGWMPYRAFDLVVLPEHDIQTSLFKKRLMSKKSSVVITRASPNVITPEYLKEQEKKLLNRFSHLKQRHRMIIGVCVGGDAKDMYISEQQVRVLSRQLKEVAKGLNADVLITTSRRTPKNIEQFLYRTFKKDARCPLLILANQEDVPEAIGGIFSLADILIVSGDSISMISEAATSGKKTIVFSPKGKEILVPGNQKHKRFVEGLNQKGYVLSVQVKDVGQALFDLAKNKIQTRPLNDRDILLQAARETI